MILAGLTPNMTTCNAALCAAKVAGCWQEAEELLEKQFGCRTIPNTLSSVFGVQQELGMISGSVLFDYSKQKFMMSRVQKLICPWFHHTSDQG